MSTMKTYNYSKAETRLLDNFSDGQWHPFKKILSQITQSAKTHGFTYSQEQLKASLKRLKAEGILMEGANESYRFVTKELEPWRMTSSTLDRTSQQLTPRYFGNILEDDGWVHAPLQTRHLVYFRASSKLTRDEVIRLTGVEPIMVSNNEEGLFRVFSTEEKTTYDLIQALKLSNPEYEISGIKQESNLRRRNIHELPPRYFSDMCVHYGEFAQVLLLGQKSSIVKHLPEKKDAEQQIYMWVIEAIKRYDDATSIPFAAYLATSVRNWVYDLNRQAYGRAIADKEHRHNRATNAFRIKEERNPSDSELAEILKLTVEEVRQEKNEINTVVNLRNQKALEYDDFEMPLPAKEETDTNMDRMIESTILSASITTASREEDGQRNLTGLLALYYQTWGVGVEDKRIKSWLRSKNTLAAVETIRESASEIISNTKEYSA